MIRAFTRDDAPRIAELVAALNAEEGYDPSKGPNAAALCDAFLGPGAIGRLLVTGEPPCGYLTMHPTFETAIGARGAYMGDLFVEKLSRRRGLGRALIAAAACQVRAEGGSFLSWTALPKNQAGRDFYEALGAEGEELYAFALSQGAFQALADRA